MYLPKLDFNTNPIKLENDYLYFYLRVCDIRTIDRQLEDNIYLILKSNITEIVKYISLDNFELQDIYFNTHYDFLAMLYIYIKTPITIFKGHYLYSNVNELKKVHLSSIDISILLNNILDTASNRYLYLISNGFIDSSLSKTIVPETSRFLHLNDYSIGIELIAELNNSLKELYPRD